MAPRWWWVPSEPLSQASAHGWPPRWLAYSKCRESAWCAKTQSGEDAGMGAAYNIGLGAQKGSLETFRDLIRSFLVNLVAVLPGIELCISMRNSTPLRALVEQSNAQRGWVDSANQRDPTMALELLKAVRRSSASLRKAVSIMKMSRVVWVSSLVVLMAGCVGEQVDAPSVDDMEAIAQEQGWSEWGDVASGVRQRSSEEGGLQTDIRGIEGHQWLLDKLADERRDLDARVNAATTAELDGLHVLVSENERLAKGAQEQIDLLRLSNAFGESGQNIYKQSDTGYVSMLGGQCSVRAYAYHYHAGYVDGLGWASCNNTAPVAAMIVGAYACVGGQCAQGVGTFNTDSTSSWVQHYGAINCVDGAQYSARGQTTVNGQTLIAEVSGTCFTYN